MKPPGLPTFCAVNLVLLAAAFWFFFPPMRGQGELVIFTSSLVIATPIVVVQHRLLCVRERWWEWLMVFYGGMLGYLFIIGFVSKIALGRMLDLGEDGGIVAAIGSGYLLVFVGQIYGVFIVPIVFGANVVLAKATKRR